MQFKPRKDNLIDKKIGIILKLKKIRDIPVIHIKEDLYFVGLYKVRLTIVGEYLYLKIGSKQKERFAEYMKNNYEKIK